MIHSIKNFDPIPMRISKQPLVFLQWNTKVCSFIQTLIHFFFSEIQKLLLYANGHLFLFCFFLQRNTKFCGFTQTVVFFYSKIPDFENCSHTARVWTKHLDTFHFLAQFSFTTSETELDYYHQKVNVQVTSRVAEPLGEP